MAYSFINIKNKGSQYLLSTLLVIFVAAIGYVVQGIVGYRVIALMLLVAVSLLAIGLDKSEVHVEQVPLVYHPVESFEWVRK